MKLPCPRWGSPIVAESEQRFFFRGENHTGANIVILGSVHLHYAYIIAQ